MSHGHAEERRGVTRAADGARLAWSQWGGGSPDAPTIVLVHGITDSRAAWFDLPQRFVAAGADVLAVDLRGHGESSTTAPYDAATFATDLAAVLADRGVDAPVLVGHSLGGIVVTATAPLVPGVRAVVNVDQPLQLDAFGALVGSIWPALEADLHGTLAAVFATMTPDSLPADVRAQFDASLALADGDVVRAIWAPLVESPADEVRAMVDAILGGITVPYLALHGADPGPGYADWLRARIPNAVYEEWDGTLHFPHLVDPDRFVARVIGFANLAGA